ncbi:MAG: carbohydrate-binding domain-containing protein, partial [Lachnospiraceae bacterium]|nr:carbohydrate-binding domain-containing protein [Lachnospiraceae bacterium]
MARNKHTVKICLIILAAAVVLTSLFIYGRKAGIIPGSGAKGDTVLINLKGTKAKVEGKGAYVSQTDVVIKEAGSYLVRGSLDNGRLIVDTDSDAGVYVTLENVSMHCEDDACIRVEEADEVFLTLVSGSVNTLTGGSAYSDNAIEDGAEAVVFSHDDLTINGSGSLEIRGDYKHGIKANDDLTLSGTEVSVTAADDAIHVNDDVAIVDTKLRISAGDDGITTEGTMNTEGSDIVISECREGLEAFNINIYSGDIEIYPEDDGLNA